MRTWIIVAVLALPLCAQPPVAIEAIPVAGSVHMITGQGGNIGLSTGEDGIFVIDDQFAPLSATIMKKIKEIQDGPVRFLVNTHWHGDHTGGNENFAKAGAIIVAHQNVRTRMSTRQFSEVLKRETPPSEPKALPVVTFTEELTFHWNGDEIHVFHVRNAHTDGDVIIHFKKADVFHMGDCFVNGQYPYIDLDSGGSFDGVIATAEKVIGLASDTTRIIPGHGKLASKKDLEKFRDVLLTVRGRVAALVKESKSDDEIVAAAPTKELDPTWANAFMKPDVWLRIVSKSIRAAPTTKDR